MLDHKMIRSSIQLKSRIPDGTSVPPGGRVENLLQPRRYFLTVTNGWKLANGRNEIFAAFLQGEPASHAILATDRFTVSDGIFQSQAELTHAGEMKYRGYSV